MDKKKFNLLKRGDIVHWKGDDPSTMPQEAYNWVVIQVYLDNGTNETILIENDKMMPYFLDKDDACNQLE